MRKKKRRIRNKFRKKKRYKTGKNTNKLVLNFLQIFAEVIKRRRRSLHQLQYALDSFGLITQAHASMYVSTLIQVIISCSTHWAPLA